jgi:hypothetical protein
MLLLYVEDSKVMHDIVAEKVAEHLDMQPGRNSIIGPFSSFLKQGPFVSLPDA